jgi:hypothetical protein
MVRISRRGEGGSARDNTLLYVNDIVQMPRLTSDDEITLGPRIANGDDGAARPVGRGAPAPRRGHSQTACPLGSQAARSGAGRQHRAHPCGPAVRLDPRLALTATRSDVWSLSRFRYRFVHWCADRVAEVPRPVVGRRADRGSTPTAAATGPSRSATTSCAAHDVEACRRSRGSLHGAQGHECRALRLGHAGQARDVHPLIASIAPQRTQTGATARLP